MSRFKTNLSLALVLAVVGAAPLYAQPSPLLTTRDEAKLIAIISTDAPHKDKVDACRQLAIVGTKNAVPALTSLLDDEKLSHMARYALEPIADPSVDVALRAALAKQKGRRLVGLIASLGARRDKGAVPALSERLGDADELVAAAAARALGRIGTPEAAKTLSDALETAPAKRRPAVADGCLGCAEAMLKAGQRKEAAAMYARVAKAELPSYIRLAANKGLLRTKGE